MPGGTANGCPARHPGRVILRVLAASATAIGVLAACAPATESATVATAPARTVPLTIEVPAPCDQVEQEFAPLTLAAGDYKMTIEPSGSCEGSAGSAALTYQAQIPQTGAVQVNPGTQPAATFAAEDVQDAVTITYQESGNGFTVATVEPPLRS